MLNIQGLIISCYSVKFLQWKDTFPKMVVCMSYEFSVYGLLMGAVSVLALFLLLYPLFFRPKSRITWYFIAMIGSTAIWCIGNTFEILAIDKPTMMFWTKFAWIGIATLSPLFLLFVLAFINNHVHVSKPFIGLLFFLPFFHYLCLLTNDSHHLFYQSVAINHQTPFISLDRVYGPITYFHTFYSYLLLTIGVFLLVRTYLNSTEINLLYQKQLRIVIIGLSVPIIWNITYLFNIIFPNISPLSFLDLTAISFVICYILFSYALFEVDFLDIIPFTHRFILKNLGDIGIVSTNKDNLIIDINPRACQYIFETGCQDIIGNDLFATLYEQERLKPYYEEIRLMERSLSEIHESLSFEMEFLDSPEPSEQFFRITLKPIRDKGNVLGFIYIVQNIFLEKEIELLLRKSIDFKNSLLGVISHDFKNQLMVIQGFTDVLRKELVAAHTKNFDELEESLNGIDAKATQMEEILTDVRSYLKTMGIFEKAQLSVINLRETIIEVISSFETAMKSKNIKIDVNWPSEPKIYTLADLRLHSVFNNILDNAIKWSPPNDVIEISVKKEKQFWICSIGDHGPGVPDGIKEEIFKPFVSIGPDSKVGSGLGLSISLEILQSYKSRIYIKDVKPRGVKLVFRLPIVKEKDS